MEDVDEDDGAIGEQRRRTVGVAEAIGLSCKRWKEKRRR